MPKSSPIQTSFSGGEFSPLVQGRVDVERYKTGLEVLANYFPTLQGPIIRRPGTKYVCNVKDPSKPPALIPFQFSADQSYMLEFGDQYIRFMANEGQVITNTNVFKVAGTMGYNSAIFTQLTFNALRSTPNALNSNESILTSSIVNSGQILELVSPYAQTDVAAIKYAQNADTLFLFHPSYVPYKLQRSGNLTWSLKPTILQDGPFLPFNSYKTIGDSTRITLTPSGVGLGTLSTGPVYIVVDAANDGTGRIRIATNTAHTFASGDRVVVRAVPGSVPVNNGTSSIAATFWTVSVPNNTHLDLVGSTFSGTMTGSSGVVSPALFEMYQAPSTWADATTNKLRNFALIQSGVRYWGTIIGVSNPASATFDMFNDLSAAIETATWQMGDFNLANGYPSSGCFHQDRLVLAGAPNYPTQVDLSKTGDYENFAASGSSLQVADNNALSFKLLASDVNPIKWVKSSAQGLLAGGGVAEYQIAPNNQGAALTPTNVNAAATSFFGSANVDAVQAGNAVIYLQNAYRKVREMNYFFQVGTFRSTDLTELADDITIPGINKLAVQKEPFPLVWACRTDGVLLSMSYNRDDQTIKAGWARHMLGGQSNSGGDIPLVKSIGVISASSATFDQLWMTVSRFINGTSVVTVETLTTPFNSATAQEDGYCLDGGATYDAYAPIAGVSVASSCVVTAPLHGFSNGDVVKIDGVLGVNKTSTDIDGNISTANLVNGKTFVVGSSGALTFTILDFQGNANNSTTYGTYVSGGRARKLVTSISGLTWLKNETVGIVADGGIHPDVVVNSAGVIALSYQAGKVQIGYRYNSDGTTLRAESGAADGSSIGKLRKINRVAFLLYRVGDFSFGPDFTRLLPCEFPVADQQQADVATPLFSGITRDGIEGIYDFEDNLSFRQNSGLPGMLQSITTMMDEVDV